MKSAVHFKVLLFLGSFLTECAATFGLKIQVIYVS